jgi:hypothetical protein
MGFVPGIFEIDAKSAGNPTAPMSLKLLRQEDDDSKQIHCSSVGKLQASR